MYSLPQKIAAEFVGAFALVFVTLRAAVGGRAKQDALADANLPSLSP